MTPYLSRQKMTYSKLVFFVFTFIIPFFFILLPSSSSVASNYSIDGASMHAAKVNLSVYYETLSPSCANFIVRNLMTIFNNGLIDIINLRMVPWGNARFNILNNSMVCQNGLDECELNTIQACAINVWNDPVGPAVPSSVANKYYALIYCMEFLAIEGRHQNWLSCFNSLGLSRKPVMECYRNGTGTKLDMVNGNETTHLNPPQTFVPWLAVNNQALGNDYGNFTAYVCKAYKGSPVPSACMMPSVTISLNDKAVLDRKRGVEARNLTSLRPRNRISRSRKPLHKDPSTV